MALTFYTVSKDPDVAKKIDTAGMSKPSIATQITFFHDNNQKEIIEHAFKPNHINGRTNDDKHSSIKSKFVSCAPSLKFNRNEPFQQSTILHFGLANTTEKKKLNKTKNKRHLLCSSTNKNAEILWSHVKHWKNIENV